MRAIIVIALLLAFIPAAVYADCGGCNKCKQTTCSSCDKCKTKCDTGCKSKCDTCKPKCEPCKPKCDTCKPKCEPCKPKCEPCKPKCDTCKPKCEKACKPKCDTGCKPKCNTCESKCSVDKPCGKPDCDKGCAKPCACMSWMPYCGCEMVTSLCINITTACDGDTAGPLMFVLRDKDMKTVASIELAGPIADEYSFTYTFAEPMKADLLHEAVLINTTDDPLTITRFNVVGNWECGSWTFIDHTCPGAIVGPGGCPRMVMF